MISNMIDYVRYALFAVVIALAMMLYQTWDKEHPKSEVTAAPVETSATTAPTQANNYAPTINTNNAVASAPTTKPVTSAVVSSNIIHVTTDVMNMDIDALGGNIIQVKLLHYPEDLGSKAPTVLLNNDDATKYIAQSGMLSTEGPDTSKGQALYSVEKTQYTLAEGQTDLPITLVWLNNQGIKITKTFTVHKGSYAIDMNYQVDNTSAKEWQGNVYLQLMRKNTPPVSAKGIVSLATYFGAAIYDTPKKQFEKITFKDMAKANTNQTITGGWAAMVQHYFVSAWAPEQTAQSQYFTHITPDGLYTVGLLGPKLLAAPGSSVTTKATFYAGPSIADKMDQVAPGLSLTIDYGIFWIIAVSIFWIMQHIHDVVGNWGWSIVLTTLAIKLLFYHLSAKSYRSMSMMKKLQPRINALKERYGTDKQKFTQETIALYKKEKVNPMSGCLPILVQIPVFIGLYWVLIESVQLRQAPFILWIQDLSQKDPFYVLPVLMGISMFLQQRLNPPPPDPMQAKIMMFMPVVFTCLFVNFPAGLMLYWFVNNTLSFLQQWYIMRSINGADKVPAKS